MCYKEPETIDQITSGCEVLAKAEYTDRHNKATVYLQCLPEVLGTPMQWWEFSTPVLFSL